VNATAGTEKGMLQRAPDTADRGEQRPLSYYAAVIASDVYVSIFVRTGYKRAFSRASERKALNFLGSEVPEEV